MDIVMNEASNHNEKQQIANDDDRDQQILFTIDGEPLLRALDLCQVV